ncbi:hypothetical protein AWL63_22850 [Sphingomonas panacis]|uniref:Uncharacterized protein n=1 Tax=Sphingomonas panacis TaxID=1560345 RepID=A0A1B3ZG12_9SPHN|nr:hypothetical protein [Sphingomonas panacis]AOH86369.1 hypothetical protein AWL63_22850 [Sphingomonas panacis]
MDAAIVRPLRSSAKIAAAPVRSLSSASLSLSAGSIRLDRSATRRSGYFAQHGGQQAEFLKLRFEQAQHRTRLLRGFLTFGLDDLRA